MRNQLPFNQPDKISLSDIPLLLAALATIAGSRLAGRVMHIALRVVVEAAKFRRRMRT